MEIVDKALDGVMLIKPAVFNDSRGYFYEHFSSKKLENLGIDYSFVQDNLSRSVKNTVRGLHYQIGENAQGKLCQVIFGSVLDVCVDIRFGSPTFGKYYSAELNDENHNMLWIPPGFAHGFSVLSETAIFHYKCTNYYSKPDERALLYNDPALGIDWKVTDPIVSEKDAQAKLLSEINQDFRY